MNSASEYRQTQWGPWFVLLYPMSALFIVLAVSIPDVPLPYMYLLIGMLLAPLAAGVHYLTIEDVGDHLWIHFGPLPVFQKRIGYKDITSVYKGRTTLLDGWGIHWSLRGGWVWNIWGRDCLEIWYGNSVIFLGTNDSERLLNLVNKKVTELNDSHDLPVR